MAAKFICAFTLLVAVTGSSAAGISGGAASSFSTHPYYASIQGTDGKQICGGAIIAKDVVATAASCIANYQVSQLVVGVGSGQTIAIKSSTFDSAYDFVTNENDVGLLKLATPIVKSSTVGIISPASSQLASGASGKVVGFDASKKLVEIPVSIVSSKDCASGKYNYSEDEIFSSQVCALASGSGCDAAPGSPLVSNNKLVGLNSWAYACSNKGNPSVYANVATLNSWISSSSKSL